MGAPVLNGPFTMPMFRTFVPRCLQPWLYVLMAFTFQFSGGLYLGTLNQMMGETALMREDLLMCLYANLAGMAIWFPLLFRMKFRFTNKTLLCASATGVMVCNLVAPYLTLQPLLWAVCFVEGICKIQGTFECMSNIQLWMTPRRDFTVFFPWLHIVILGSMQLSDLLATALMHHYHWSYMHLFMAGVMMLDLLMLTLCTRHFRLMKKMPLLGIDWLGGGLWALLLLEVAFFFCYGEYYNWLVSPVMRVLGLCILFTLYICIGRMRYIRHPFLEPKMWTYRHLAPILLLIFLVEMLLASERVLEETFLEGVMHYEETVSVRLDWAALAGILGGCVFAWWWMHVRRFNYLRLLMVGILALVGYLLGYYLLMTPALHISQLYLPTALRGFGYAVLSATFMVCLEEIMTFQHFFQALSVFNMMHMVAGGVVGSALYGHGLRYLVADNVARHGGWMDHTALSRLPGDWNGVVEPFMQQMMEISLKQLYGWALYAAVLLLLLFLLYDLPVRSRLKPMPLWRRLRREMEPLVALRKKAREGTATAG